MRNGIIRENLTSLTAYRETRENKLDWSSIFVTPFWMQAWWQVFGSGAESFIHTVWRDNELTGIAPCMVGEKVVSFIGSPDVCDYLDFILVPGRENGFFDILLDELYKQGFASLDLGPVRADATVPGYLAVVARERGCEVQYAQEDVSLEVDLPSTWEEYLELLTTKQRHEVRRKLRRLAESGKVEYRFVDDKESLPEAMSIFFRMFTESRKDKAAFLTKTMETFFVVLARTMAEAGLLRLGVLELDSRPIAMVLCFDYNGCRYLYNSGYNPAYDYLSAGLVSKVLAIKDGIENNIKRFDFLKGAETYKYRLGGREVPLYRYRISVR